jgi:hypothetical protein
MIVQTANLLAEGSPEIPAAKLEEVNWQKKELTK